MILKNLKVFLQNVWKNKLLTNTLLEINKDFDIIFIQEPSWLIICSIPCLLSEEGISIVKASHYLNWITFSRSPSNNNNNPHAISYINICLLNLCFSL